MDDRELIIDALRAYARTAEDCARLARRQKDAEIRRRGAAVWSERAEDCLRVRAELEDNADYVLKGGGDSNPEGAACAVSARTQGPCDRGAGHPGRHHDAAGNEWEQI